jgi:hypothetical protein
MFQLEPEMPGVELDRSRDIGDLIPDSVKSEYRIRFFQRCRSWVWLGHRALLFESAGTR